MTEKNELEMCKNNIRKEPKSKKKCLYTQFFVHYVKGWIPFF